jgi:hypothetical protein
VKKTGILMGILMFTATVVAGAQNISVDNSYYDWQDIPALAAFTRYFNPYYFNRESGAARQRLTIDRSVYWDRGGTRLREIKGTIGEEAFFFYIGADTNFARELSIYGYVYEDRSRRNRFALELMPARTSDGGYVALWSDDGEVTEVGVLRNTSFFLECRIPWSELPSELKGANLRELSIDITTCYYEAASGTYEEFYLTTLYLRDLVRPGEI